MIELTHHEVTIVKKPWEDVGKETYCDIPGCDECRIIDKATQGSGASQYWDSKYPWIARVREVLVIDTPIISKQYRVWVLELFRNGPIAKQFEIKTVTEYWSAQKRKWR